MIPYFMGVASFTLLVLTISVILLSSAYTLYYNSLQITISKKYLSIIFTEYLCWCFYGIFGIFYYSHNSYIAFLMGTICVALGSMTFYIYMAYRLWYTFNGTAYQMPNKYIYIQSCIISILFVLFTFAIIFLHIGYTIGLSVLGGSMTVIYNGGLFYVIYKFNSKFLKLFSNIYGKSVTTFQFSDDELLLIHATSKQSLLSCILLMMFLLLFIFWCVVLPLSLIMNDHIFLVQLVWLSGYFFAYTFVFITYFSLAMNANIYTKVCSFCDIKFRHISESCTKKKILEKQKQMNHIKTSKASAPKILSNIIQYKKEEMHSEKGELVEDKHPDQTVITFSDGTILEMGDSKQTEPETNINGQINHNQHCLGSSSQSKISSPYRLMISTAKLIKSSSSGNLKVIRDNGVQSVIVSNSSPFM